MRGVLEGSDDAEPPVSASSEVTVVPFDFEFRTQMAICFIGIVWGLHLMTRAQDYKKVRERFERSRNPYQAEKFGGRERILRLLGFLMTGVFIYYFYEVLNRFTDFEF